MKENPINAFLTRCQLWQACAKDDLHPDLEYVYFENNYAYASDAHILVKVPLQYITTLNESDYEKLNEHGIYGSLLKYLTNIWPLTIQTEGEDVTICGWRGWNEVRVTLTNPTKVKHPDFDSLFEKKGERIPISRIGIAQKKLQQLTAALGSTEVKLEFIREDQKIFVSPISCEMQGAEGIIMPMVITGTIEGF